MLPIPLQYSQAECVRVCVGGGWWQDVCVCMLSSVLLFGTPWTVDYQTPLSKEFSRQEYWSGLPFPPPEDLPDPGIEPVSCLGRKHSLPLHHLGWQEMDTITDLYGHSLYVSSRGSVLLNLQAEEGEYQPSMWPSPLITPPYSSEMALLVA